jgi:hypothetical protein
MSFNDFFGRMGRGLAVGTAIFGTVGMTAAPRPAHAIDPGAAVGIGLGSFALGTALGASANPYYNPYLLPLWLLSLWLLSRAGSGLRACPGLLSAHLVLSAAELLGRLLSALLRLLSRGALRFCHKGRPRKLALPSPARRRGIPGAKQTQRPASDTGARRATTWLAFRLSTGPNGHSPRGFRLSLGRSMQLRPDARRRLILADLKHPSRRLHLDPGAPSADERTGA